MPVIVVVVVVVVVIVVVCPAGMRACWLLHLSVFMYHFYIIHAAGGGDNIVGLLVGKRGCQTQC